MIDNKLQLTLFRLSFEDLFLLTMSSSEKQYYDL